MTEQEKFELYFNLTPRDRIDEGGGDAGYLDYEIDKAWDGWQAKASEVALQAMADEGQARDASVYSVAAPVTPSGAAGEGWQPIETAPRDGTSVLVPEDAGYTHAFWQDGGWWYHTVYAGFDGDYAVGPEPKGWRKSGEAKK